MLKRTMRIVFMGTPAFAVPSLEALIQSDDQVVGVGADMNGYADQEQIHAERSDFTHLRAAESGG